MQSLYLAVLVLFPLSEVVLLLVKRARRDSAKVDDASTGRRIWRAIGIGVVGAIAASQVRFFHVPIPTSLLFPLVVGVMLLGMAIRFTAILTLGRFFTVNVAQLNDHRLIETGLYKHLRHPSYTGSLLEFVALALSFSNVLSAVVLLVPVTVSFVKRIRHEEGVLLASLGEEYRSYMQRTKRLLPGVW